MATSFAAYASQFLNRQQTEASSLSSSQPLFFSFSTEDGSHPRDVQHSHLDDLDDPHLRASMSRTTVRRNDDDDPYLRFDDDLPGPSRVPSRHQTPLLAASDADGPKGWLAHASPLRSPSPSPSSSSMDSPRTDSPRPPSQSPPLPPPRTAVSMSLTESLLPRVGDVFSLPDPRYVPRTRRKYNDATWTTIWCTGLSACFVSSLLVLFLTHRPSESHRVMLPYITLLHTVPLLTILTFASAAVCYTHVLLLRIFVRPVMVATTVAVPAMLLFSAVWAFVGSFMWDGTQEPTWGETVGLRLFALVPLALSMLTARRLLTLPRDVHTASALLTLTTRLLAAHPLLLALSPAVLLLALLASLPFVTLAFRLLLIGYFSQPKGGGWEWHVHGWANWAIAGTIGIWLWSWGVARGVLRVTCAGVVGSWYFSDPTLPVPPPMSTHTVHAAIARATQPSLGTVILSALITTAVRLLGLLIWGLRALPAYLPPYLRFVSGFVAMAVGYLEGVTGTLSTHALVYTGLTGDAFFPSARRARALTGAAQSYRRRFKTEPPLMLLTVAPLTLTFPFALLTYLFVAHTLDAPHEALSASLLAGGVTALVGLFCIGLVKDTADTLYICYCIDKDTGERHREQVFEAFEYENRRRQHAATPAPPLPQPYSQPPPLRAQPESQRQPAPSQPPQPRAPLARSTNKLPLPPPRAETPDPFEHSPSDTDSPPYPDVDADPYSPASSRRMPLRQSMSMQQQPLEVHLESDDEDGGESQLFPGSDLF
ncbi:hypothetical protein A0H81_14255 [Grifola frondosa]|uniref:Protein PNS1 n=1 Tax=Grifola frondosa TaxID=5627 RepID=A0A1C7LP16_GRIFR|nr:hypothetical protein A0H81_14255 [Grifola frondosa]